MKRLTALGICIGLALASLPLLMRAYSGVQQWELNKQWNAARQAALKQETATPDDASIPADDSSSDDSDWNAPPRPAEDPAPAKHSVPAEHSDPAEHQAPSVSLPPLRGAVGPENQSAGTNRAGPRAETYPAPQIVVIRPLAQGPKRATDRAHGLAQSQFLNQHPSSTQPAPRSAPVARSDRAAPGAYPGSLTARLVIGSKDGPNIRAAASVGTDRGVGGFRLGPSMDLDPGSKVTKIPHLRARPRPRPFVDQWPLRLRIPRLHLDVFVVRNVTNSALADGPGHFPETALPWQLGNCVIAGHRNIWGSWFDHLGRLRPGDRVILETVRHRYVYRITGRDVVSPGDTGVLRDHGVRRELTLVTCTPGAADRLVAHAAYERTTPSSD